MEQGMEQGKRWNKAKMNGKAKMEQGKNELFSGLQLDEQQWSWSPSKTTKRKNSTEQTELESQVKQS